LPPASPAYNRISHLIAMFSMSVLSMSDSNLALPLSMKPACNTSSRQNRTGHLEIPLWEKPSCASNIGDYVGIVPLHHAKATEYLAKQRELALQRPAAEAGGEANSMDSTIADDMSDGSSNESALADFASREGLDESEQADQSTGLEFSRKAEVWSAAETIPQMSRIDALVASLRDARQQAHARRIALSAHADCASEVVIDDGANLCQMELLAALRNAREYEASQRTRPVFTDTPTAATEATFSVTIVTLNGSSREVHGLHSHMIVEELLELVANTFKIPNFAVRLMWKAEILHMSQPATPLHVVGIEEGVQLTLVKNFGWAKPDVTKLHELGMVYGSKTSVPTPP